MIKIITNGNLFESDCQAIVNTVNCVGVMGGGIALAFKQKFPDMYQDYKNACDNNELKPGFMHVWKKDNLIIINFPTKDKVQFDSKIEYIESGLLALIEIIEKLEIKSIAIPALGCGLGGLDWNVVKNLIIKTLDNLDCEILLFEPH